MKQNATQSPLLRLPPELRNQIFAYVVGNYDIYIGAFNDKKYFDPRTKSDGTSSKAHDHLYYRLVTIILPHGADYRPAAPDDDLPNLSLPQVCRQIYPETTLLPYTLNHFIFVKSRWALRKNVGGYVGGNNYTTLDLWLERRLPVQINALTCIAPTIQYQEQYFMGKRSAFITRFPGLRVLDLGALRGYMDSELDEELDEELDTKLDTQWRRLAQKKDVESDILIVYSTLEPRVLSRQLGGVGPGTLDNMMMKPSHFSVEIQGDID
jgi:hypothetical protein